jgi:S-adenosylmethionine hydrolase
MRPVVTFLSDFGSADPFVGICHGVIVRTCPDAEVIHLAHGIDAQSVAQGARVLAASIAFLPVGVHLAVVDPGVGSQRRAVVLRSGDGRLFVGPDNGLLVPAAEACGGIELAVEITDPDYMLDAVSRTFHGRDVFAPVAGHLAAGLDPLKLGRRSKRTAWCGRLSRDLRSRERCSAPPCSTSIGSATSSSRSAQPIWASCS